MSRSGTSTPGTNAVKGENAVDHRFTVAAEMILWFVRQTKKDLIIFAARVASGKYELVWSSDLLEFMLMPKHN